MRPGYLVVAAMVALVVVSPSTGHHSEAAFDSESVVVLEGAVVEYNWRSPHVYIVLATTDATGELVQWEIETGATPLMTRSGWTPDSFAAGDRISVRAHPARQSGRRYALLLSLAKEDGSVLAQVAPESAAAASASDLEGVWRTRTSVLEPLLGSLSALELTEKGAAARDTFDMDSAENPAAMCVPYPTPATVIGGLYLSEIEINEDTIVIRSEFFDAERTVFMDGRGHPDDGERTIQGHSIGWWEGDVLVVDTTRFADHRAPFWDGIPSGSQKHVVERYRLSEDGTRAVIEIFVEDPEYLAAPFTGTVEWVYAPDLELLRYDCDPEVSIQFAP